MEPLEPNGEVIERLQAISLEVSQFDRAVEFYRTIMGLEVQILAPNHYATIPRVNISLVSSSDHVTSDGFHIELVVTDVDSWYQHVENLGATVLTQPRNQSWGSRNFYMLDSEGHTLELTTPMEMKPS